MDYLVGTLAFVSGVAMIYAFARRRILVGCGTAYLCALAVGWLLLEENTAGYRPPPRVDPLAEARPQEEAFDNYVSSDTCRSCHPGEYHSWRATYHRTMTQVASAESILADDFDGRIFRDGGLAFAMEKRGDEVWARIYPEDLITPAPSEIRERRIVMTTGSHNYQAYWLDGEYLTDERPDDRKVTIFPFVYLLDEKEWIPRMDAFLVPPYSGLNSLHSGEWNTNCLNCHSTHGAPQTVVSDNIMTTRAAEFGIACEACHGPGEEHVAANRNPLRRYEVRREAEAGSPDPTIVNPAHLDKELSSHVCARCHALTGGFREVQNYSLHGYAYQPGQNLYDTFFRLRYEDWFTNPVLKVEAERNPAVLNDVFWSDGMVRVAGREFSGLLETPCFQKGEMSCLSCHKLHKSDADSRPLQEWTNDLLAPDMRTNAACVQCHDGFSDEAAVAAHTHHPVPSAASNCYNCHMPHTTFGLLKAIRSHTVDSPDVATSLATGRPNACNQCHLDKSLGWAAQALHEWYDTPIPEMNADEQNVAASVLWTLKGDAGIRALMAWSFGWEEARKTSGDEWMGVYLSFLLEDSYAAVRLVAGKSLHKYAGFENLPKYPYPLDVKSRAFAMWTQQHPGGLNFDASHLLLESNGTFDLEPAVRLMEERDHTPITLKE